MNQLEITRREFLAKEVLRYLIANPQSGIFTPTPKAERTARLHATGKPWQSGARMQQQKPEIKEVTLSELLALTDGEILDLHKLVEKAIAAKRVATRQARYHLK